MITYYALIVLTPHFSVAPQIYNQSHCSRQIRYQRQEYLLHCKFHSSKLIFNCFIFYDNVNCLFGLGYLYNYHIPCTFNIFIYSGQCWTTSCGADDQSAWSFIIVGIMNFLLYSFLSFPESNNWHTSDLVSRGTFETVIVAVIDANKKQK